MLLMVREIHKAINEQPFFWVFMCIVVVVGGPAFLNQTVERFWPSQAQIEIAEDVEWIERRSNQFNKVLQNQKRMLEILAELQRGVTSVSSDVVGLDLRIARLEAWRHFEAKSRREELPGEYP